MLLRLPSEPRSKPSRLATAHQTVADRPEAVIRPPLSVVYKADRRQAQRKTPTLSWAP